MKRILSLIGAIALTAILVVPAAAHTQTVTPPSKDEPVVGTTGISRPWAQAHCQAYAEYVVADASNGVVVFDPPFSLPCTAANPAGH
jgi:hypothetical protein